MKIQVVRNDGSREAITLTEPLTVIRGDRMNRLVCQTGMEHWFTEDGIYDGWGMAVKISAPDSSSTDLPAEASEFIDAIERDREILPNPPSSGGPK